VNQSHGESGSRNTLFLLLLGEAVPTISKSSAPEDSFRAPRPPRLPGTLATAPPHPRSSSQTIPRVRTQIGPLFPRPRPYLGGIAARWRVGLSGSPFPSTFQPTYDVLLADLDADPAMTQSLSGALAAPPSRFPPPPGQLSIPICHLYCKLFRAPDC
jgi:hypothetical protein